MKLDEPALSTEHSTAQGGPRPQGMDTQEMKRKKPVREAVLDAAMDLVETTSNAAQLTLDAVSAHAGVSKGGLLHHFKTKEALLTAMIERIKDGFEAERQAAVARIAAIGGSAGARDRDFLETYLDRSFAGLGAHNHSAMALFAVAAHHPGLLQPVREYYAQRTADILKESKNPHATLALMLMADGLWLFDALGIPPFDGKIREEVLESVKSWARQALEPQVPVKAAPARSKRARAGGRSRPPDDPV